MSVLGKNLDTEIDISVVIEAAETRYNDLLIYHHLWGQFETPADELLFNLAGHISKSIDENIVKQLLESSIFSAK